MKVIIDAIKEDVFYYPLRSDLKPDYKLNIDNQKMESNVSEFYTSEKRTKKIVNGFNKLIVEKEKKINKELFKKHFGFQTVFDIQKGMHKTKKTSKNEELVNSIKSRLVDLKK